ncbi:hypothetical protein [Saccharicrinis sp. 156]|uniref:hypothetical protein n=1 Tax=Saccharicrinis sp. 156 TaxID=3417574 RepID=UPI003D34D352
MDTNCKIDISKIKLAGRTEFYVNASADSAMSLNDGTKRTIEEFNLSPINHFILGIGTSSSSTSKESSKQAQPLTWLTGNRNDSKGIIFSQLTAVQDISLKPISFKGQIVGNCYEDDYARYIRLVGLLPDDLSENRENQTLSLLNNMRDCLVEQGMTFQHVIRTWFYLDDLLEWYGDFNVWRTHFFHREKVFDGLVPASTGIGTANHCGAEIIGDLIAVLPKSDELIIERAKSPLQGSAMDYKSSFSRGVEIKLPGCNTLYISGTASIDKAGETLFLDDAEKQIKMTMEVVTEMLNVANMNWRDVKRGIAYFKHGDYVPYFIKYCEGHKINHSPIAIFIADVCRDDLLFEIEVDSVQLGC